jgi:chemotaxis protein methyltransferase CheR
MPSPTPLAEPIRPLTEREFSNISRLAYKKFGLQLKPEKYELVTARLGKKVRAAGCRSFQEYYQRVVDDGTGEALIELIDALATNFTNFMREPAHFDFLLKEVLPACAGLDRLAIWSAAWPVGRK